MKPKKSLKLDSDYFISFLCEKVKKEILRRKFQTKQANRNAYLKKDIKTLKNK